MLLVSHAIKVQYKKRIRENWSTSKTYSAEYAALGPRVQMLASNWQSCDGLTYADLDSVKGYNHILAELLEDGLNSWLQFEVVVFQVSVSRWQRPTDADVEVWRKIVASCLAFEFGVELRLVEVQSGLVAGFKKLI
jgi:hypothetical protein